MVRKTFVYLQKNNSVMKNRKISLFVLLLWMIVFVACDKYDSKIIGKATYLDTNNQISYPAAGAIITKISVDGDRLSSIVAVFADGNGEFVFDHTTKGSWQLSGKLEKDSTVYFGLSEHFTTNGNNQTELLLLLEPLNRDTSE
jgi:hypothetical protein